jgi:hypothetical protein
MSMFCRHNRLTATCPICAKESQFPTGNASGSRGRAAGASRTTPRSTTGGSGAGTTRRSSTRLVTRKLARAEDDGYRNVLVPGMRAVADAERLAAALVLATQRLAPPGPYPAVAQEDDRDEALWLAFLLALVGPDAPERQAALLEQRPSWASGDDPELPAEQRRTAQAYRAWAKRSGSQAAAFEGEANWTPVRRFARLFERLSLPGFGRARRFELLNALGAAGLYEVEADALHFGAEDDATTQAAKRLLVSGDRMLLERRARELSAATGVPLAALDRGLALWGAPATPLEAPGELPDDLRRALRLS